MLVVGCIPNFSSERFVGRVASTGACSVRFLAHFFSVLSLLPFRCLRFISLHNHFYPPDLKTQHEEHSHFYKRLRCTVQYLIKAVGSHRDIPHHPTCYLHSHSPVSVSLHLSLSHIPSRVILCARAGVAHITHHTKTHSFANSSSSATYVHVISLFGRFSR